MAVSPNMPSPNNKVRVFISSTFRDMHSERDLSSPSFSRSCTSAASDWDDTLFGSDHTDIRG